MEEKVKYAIFLAVVILVSVCSSYITTLALKPNQSSTNFTDNQQQAVNTNSTSTNTNSTLTLVHALSYETRFEYTPYNSVNEVIVGSNIIMHNLTITYQYTCLNGTKLQTKVTYGDFCPSWQASDIPLQGFRIPVFIMNACSSTKTDNKGDIVWDVFPQLNVTDVSGYS